jgi:hypothetical protein
MRKGLFLLAALLLAAAAPSATVAQKAKGGPELVGDAASQILVPFQSMGRAAQPATKAKAKKAKRSKKAKAKKPSKAKKKSSKAKKS